MHLLHLEDSENDALLVTELVREEWPDCRIDRVVRRADFEAALATGAFDLILSDYSLPDFDGLSALELARERCPSKPFIFISGTIGEERAIEALKRGAVDYIIKDHPNRLIPAIRSALARSEEAKLLRRAEEQLRDQATLLDKARDAIIATDLNHRIAYWNASAERLYGWSASEVFGRLLDDLDLGYDAAHFTAASAQLLATGEWRGDFRLHDRTGGSLQVESTWSLVLGADGKPRTILLIDTDVTEKRKLESRLLQADRMDSIGMLAGGVAHDLNNVLAPILMGAELLRMSLKEPKDIRIVEHVERSAQHGSELVRQLLTFARGGEGEKVEIQPAALVEDVRKLLAQGVPRNIELVVSCAPSCRPIEADATQVKQLLLNLCINARDAMPEGGRLEIRAENATADEKVAKLHPGASAGPHLLVSVTDTGVGIPPEILEKIFDPFFTTKGVGKGTGLGLSTVAGIVRNHGGFLEVESRVGEGTTFKLMIPNLLPAVPSRSGHPFPEAGGKWILVIDDDPMVCETFRVILEKAGYRVVTAQDGRTGVAEFERRHEAISVAITDMIMPSMNGSQVIDALRACDPAVRIIAVSGFFGSSELTARLDLQAVAATLVKPIDMQQLLGTLRRVIAA